QRRPERRALSAAGALSLAVLLEQVKRPPARVDEDPPEAGLGSRDDGPTGLGGLARQLALAAWPCGGWPGKTAAARVATVAAAAATHLLPPPASAASVR